MVKQSFDTSAGIEASDSRVALYVYPGDFERRGLVVDGGTMTYAPVIEASASTETQYLVAGARMVWDHDTAPTAGTDLDRNRRVTIPVSDLLHTTAASVDLLSGELLEVSTYYPNGARETLLVDEGSEGTLALPGVPLEPMGFTGKEADEDVGLVYFGERYLIGRLGRWASPDPLHVHAMGGGVILNSYHYVGGNHLQSRDPLGLDSDVRATARDSSGNATAVEIQTRILIVGPTEGSRQEIRREVEAAIAVWSGTYTTQVDGRDVSVSLSFTVVDVSDENVARFAAGYAGLMESDSEVEDRYARLARELGGNVVYSRPTDPRDRDEISMGNPVGGRSHFARGRMLNLTPSALEAGAHGRHGTASHEFGHLLGLQDRYEEATGRPGPGWAGNIMADNSIGMAESQRAQLARQALSVLDQPSVADPQGFRGREIHVGEPGLDPAHRPLWHEFRRPPGSRQNEGQIAPPAPPPVSLD